MRLAVLFPGQGSQHPGMVDPWLADSRAAAVVAAANEVAGYPIAEVARDPAALERTDVVQAATFVCEMAAWRVFAGEGGVVAATAGHSLGEYAALAAAGVIEFGDALGIVVARGRAMQAAADAGHGAMVAVVGATLDEAATVCAHAAEGEVLVVANENSPVQTVLSGTAAAVARAEALAVERRFRAMRLPLRGGFHSPLMEAARSAVADAIASVDFRPASFPVVPNATATPTRDPGELREALLRHLVSPVRWAASMQALLAAGIDRFAELGPGNVLTKLSWRCAPGTPAAPAGSPAEVAELAAAVAG